MTKTIAMLQTRIAVLKSRSAENGAIIKKLERKIRKLSK